MYRYYIYLNFNSGEFRLLETWQCWADNRQDGKEKATKYAYEKYSKEYPRFTFSAISVN